MPDGLSPEVKHAPDAPKAVSGSSPEEKQQQPKIEIAPNLSPHPAETFPWLPRDEYFRQRDRFVPTMIPIITENITSDPEFAYRDNPQITQTVATLFSRALFVWEYFRQHPPQEHHIPINTYAGAYSTS